MKIIAKEWSQLDKDEKTKYNNKAISDKERYKREFQEFKLSDNYKEYFVVKFNKSKIKKLKKCFVYLKKIEILKCKYCRNVFYEDIDLHNHFLSAHEYVKCQCKNCIKQVTGNKKCKFCEKMFVQFVDLHKHIRSVHEETKKKDTCNFCGLTNCLFNCDKFKLEWDVLTLRNFIQKNLGHSPSESMGLKSYYSDNRLKILRFLM